VDLGLGRKVRRDENAVCRECRLFGVRLLPGDVEEVGSGQNGLRRMAVRWREQCLETLSWGLEVER
jgi:hypothetical protein